MLTTLSIRNGWLPALATALLCLPLSNARAEDGKDKKLGDQKQIKVVVRTADGNQDQDLEKIEIIDLAIDEDDRKPSTYWIGVLCTPLEDDLLKLHLKLDHALVITEVLDDSPAKIAGLQKQDIMVKVAGEPLTELKVLAANIERAKDGEITLTIVRQGEEREVKVVPAKRPVKLNIHQSHPDAEATKEWKMLQEALRKRGAVAQKAGDDNEERDLSMMLVMPGVILPDQVHDLPKNLEVTITKKGKEDAKITVKQGDKQWNVDTKSLHKLPEEIRPHIEKMLGHGHEMKFHFEGKDLTWPFPKNLTAPRIFEKSLQIAPDKIYELHKLEQGLNKELRDKIQFRLNEANRVLEEAKTKIPEEALERVENELKVLRQQIEQLRKEREDRDEQEEEE